MSQSQIQEQQNTDATADENQGDHDGSEGVPGSQRLFDDELGHMSTPPTSSQPDDFGMVGIGKKDAMVEEPISRANSPHTNDHDLGEGAQDMPETRAEADFGAGHETKQDSLADHEDTASTISSGSGALEDNAAAAVENEAEREVRGEGAVIVAEESHLHVE